MVLAKPQEYYRRLAICTKCEFIKKFNRCKLCGCFMNVKAKLKGMTCPENKWNK